jgi:hypothetical protein
MKSSLTPACFAALLILGNLASAQTSPLDNPLANPNHEAPPPTTKARVEGLKVRHAESLATLIAALDRIAGDPALLGAKETFAAIDKADRDMKRSESASDVILTSLRSEVAAIKADPAFADDQQAELERAAKAMADECIAVRKEAEVVIKNLAKSYKALAQAKKVYRSYLNLQGESQAMAKLKATIGEFVNGLIKAPAETQPADNSKDEKKSV